VLLAIVGMVVASCATQQLKEHFSETKCSTNLGLSAHQAL
jgi:hypothetical protein